ncbi:hypothetical protein [Devosia sp.]|uniref:hypothetical protein n=1 Tax=Devosia sp. TaxID=1871048 RepID=UPI0026211C18|nr:hypothetical protein [Devosia sp.]
MADEVVASRRESITTAIRAELQRQGVSGVDIEALAEAIETAIAAHAPLSEGRHPDELNATNDD